VGVAAELGDQHVGGEGVQRRGDDRLEGVEVDLAGGGGCEGHVERRARTIAPPDLVGEAGAGEQVAARLVQADRQDARVVVEELLDAVAVVGVDVDVGDPLRPVAQQPVDRHRRVVVDAEARRAVGHGVMQPAGRVEGVGDPPSQTARAAATDAPQTSRDASCIPANTGLSARPRPKRGSPAGSGASDRRLTAST
jgi:hypothetical protein